MSFFLYQTYISLLADFSEVRPLSPLHSLPFIHSQTWVSQLHCGHFIIVFSACRDKTAKQTPQRGKNDKHAQFTSSILIIQNVQKDNVSLIDPCTGYICSEVWDTDSETDTQVRPSCSSEIPPATNNSVYFDHCWMELLVLDLAYWAKKQKPSISFVTLQECHCPFLCVGSEDIQLLSASVWSCASVKIHCCIFYTYPVQRYVTVLEFVQWIVQKSC